jgi:mannose-6-phosphate isomerase-like protein (cupin superfamily)
LSNISKPGSPAVYRFEDGGFTRALAHDGAAPILFKRVAEAATGSAARWIDLVIVPPGADIGEHTHGPSDEEIYIIVDGHGRMVVDGHAVDIGKGDVIVNRPGGTHSLVNTGRAELTLVVVDVNASR